MVVDPKLNLAMSDSYPDNTVGLESIETDELSIKFLEWMRAVCMLSSDLPKASSV